ncbi:hypothetical protein H1D32_02675 [Anaerobacillus sp. CMMVII]|nr:hypothetical protein [Anaerobacillus sp. CMMVII]MCT8136753.1 hypothetical protein [Anaerobacillus sp. CMMVII]
MTKHEQFDGGSTWEGNNGFLISAPSTNRTEAIMISNELMKDFLRGYTLE